LYSGIARQRGLRGAQESTMKGTAVIASLFLLPAGPAMPATPTGETAQKAMSTIRPAVGAAVHGIG
jgi:hypothetical protein